MELVVTFGITGSGKSRVARDYEAKGYVRICPDDIRKELTGSISDQSQNGRVFSLAFERVANALDKKLDVVFDSTALHGKTRKELREMGQIAGARTVLVNLTDSKVPEICRARVAKDLAQGVDRSNTLVDEGIITRQYENYKNHVGNIDTEGWDEVRKV